MPRYRHLIFLALALAACGETEKDTSSQSGSDTGEGVDCAAMVLPCPDGQVACEPETDDECFEVTLGEEPCTQTRYCMPE